MSGLFGRSTGNTKTSVPMANGLHIQQSAYGSPIPLVYGKNRVAGNLIWYGDFVAIPHTSTQSSGGKGGGGGNQTTTSYTYSTAVAIALCEGPATAVGQIWKGKQIFTGVTALFNGGAFLGTYPTQTPWSYLTSKHPGQDLGYQGICYVAAGPYALGNSPDLGSHSFEVTGFLPYNHAGAIDDCDPKAWLVDFLTDANHGVGMALARIGDLTQFSNFCVANNLLISPVFDTAAPAGTAIERIVQGLNSEIFFSEGLIKIVPYGDSIVTGNGVTFTPNLTPVYNFTDDDYIAPSSGDPVRFDRSNPVDAFNKVIVECFDRAEQYAPLPAEAKDQNGIETYGLRPAPTFQFHWICQASIAQTVAQMKLQRVLYVRNQYTFTVGYRFAVLEPMDLVTLTDSVLGLSALIVRIKSIEEDDSGALTIIAEDALLGSGTPALYTAQNGSGYGPNYNAAPGNVSAPTFVDAPGILTNSGYEIWVATAGGANWGGCEVWVSTDNATFQQVGVLFGNSRYGVSTSSFAAGSDPDTVNTLPVDLTTSTGALTGGTQADADAFNTLAIVDRELIAFQAATLTATYKYTLGTYIRRGVYRSAIAAHATNAPFVRLDQALFRYPYDSKLVGTPIYFKFVSFNKYNRALQDISTLSSYSYTPQGSTSYPSNVTNFTASQNSAVVIFTWDLLTAPLNPNIDGYEIRYTPQGDLLWNDGTPLTQVTRGTQVTSVRLPPGAWTCMIKARDHSNNYSQSPAYSNINVTNMQTVIVSEDQTQGWPNQELAISNTASITASALTLAAPLTVEWSGTLGAFVSTDKLAYSGTGAAANNWILSVDVTGKATWNIIDNAAVSHAVTMASALSAGVPHHLLGIYDGTNITLYVDGVQAATLAPGAFTFSSTTAPVFAPPATGSMCEARIYNRALSASEDTARYQGYDNTTGLVLKYLFTYQTLKTAGQIADLSISSGGPNTGTIAGTPAYTPSSFAQKFAADMMGILLPESTQLASVGATGYEWVNNFVNAPFQYCTYTTRDFDLGSDGSARLHGELLSGLGIGVVTGAANPTLYEDDHLTATSYHGFSVWTIGTSLCRFFKMKIGMDTVNQGLAFVKGFTPTADVPPLVQSAGNIVVPNTGLTITYPTRYHKAPTVKITVIGTSALSATANNISATTFDVHVFNSSGTEVGGTIIWESTGV